MKTPTLFPLLFCFIFTSSYAQINLISNGDFESTTNACDYHQGIITPTAPNGISSELIQFDPSVNDFFVWQCGGTPNQPNNFPQIANCNNNFPTPPMPHTGNSPNFNYHGLYFFRNNSSYANQELAYFDLGETMSTDKCYELSFWARMTDPINCPDIILNVVGDDIAPCVDPIITNIDGSISACGFTANVLDAALPVTISGSWTKYIIALNNLPEDINHIIIYPSTSNLTESNYLLIDDVEIYEAPRITIQENISNFNACVDEVADITYTICYEGEGNGNPTAIAVEPTIPNGFTIVGGDFLGGNPTIAINGLNSSNNYCQNFTLSIAAQPNDVTLGQSYSIPIIVDMIGTTNECIVSSESLITPVDCFDCDCPIGSTSIVIGSGTTNLSDVLPSTFYVNSTCFSIAENAKLIIDQNYLTFSNCSFIMGPGSEIELNPNLYCTVNNSTFRGCTNIWKGISPKNNSTFTLKSCIVRDAKYAINLNNEANISLENNLFIRNLIGVYAHKESIIDGDQLNYGNNPIYLKNNIFSGEGTYLPNYPNQAFAFASISPVGFLLRNTSMIIGNLDAPNYFSHLSRGVSATNGFVGLYNVEMANFTASPSLSIGVYVNDGIIWMNYNKIKDPAVGVIAKNAWLSIADNEIQNGIECDNVTSGCHINNNIIDGFGIRVNGSLYGQSVNIENNQVTDAGMNISGFPYGKIIDNTISENADHSGAGIAISSSKNLLVYRNTISLSPGPQQIRGIDLIGSSFCRLKDNSISAPIGVNFHGIKNTASSNNHFCCNDITGTYYGVYFYGYCSPTFLKYTEMKDNVRGLKCNDGTVIGQQVDGGNKWLGTFDFPALHTGSNMEIFDSQFFVEDGDPTTSVLDKVPPLWPSEDVDPSWFIESPQTSSSCIQDAHCNDSFIFPDVFTGTYDYPDNLVITETDKRAITTGYTSSPYADMLNWEGSKNLLRRIEKENNLIGLDSDVDNFYSSSALENINNLLYIELQTESLQQMGESQKSSIEDARINMESIINDISNIDVEIASTTNQTEINDLLTNKKDLLAQINSNVISTQNILNQIADDNAIIINDLLVSNAAIITNTVIEENEKIVNDVYLKTMAIGNLFLTSDQFSSISSVAFQCPKIGGHVVYTARLLYNLNQEYEFDDDKICTNVEKRSTNKESEVENNILIKIFPNPVSEELNINLDANKIDRIQLFSMFSGQLFEKSVTENNFTIDTKNISTGMYYVSFYQENDLIETKKIVIVH